MNWSRIMLTGHTALALAVVFVLSGNWILLLLVTFAPFTAGWRSRTTVGLISKLQSEYRPKMG